MSESSVAVAWPALDYRRPATAQSHACFAAEMSSASLQGRPGEVETPDE